MNNLGDVIGVFLGIIQPLILLIMALSILAFFKGLLSIITNAGDTKKIEEARSIIKWGLIVLFVMFVFRGILVFFVTDTFGGVFKLPLLPPNR